MNKSVHGVRTTLKIIATGVFFLLVTGCSTFGSGPAGPAASVDGSVTDASQRVYPNSIRNHVYGGIGAGASVLEPDTSDISTFDVDSRNDAGAQITLGVDLSRQFAIEAHAADLGSAGISGSGTVPGGTVDYQSVGASALLYIGGNRSNFRRRGLSGYGRLGYGLLNSSASSNLPHRELNGTHVLFGAGVEYMMSSGLGFRAEAISFDTDVNYGQLGLVYRIGRREAQRNIEIVKVEEATPAITPPVAAALPVAQICEFSGDQSEINFQTNSAVLTSSAKQMLDGFANELSECEAVSLSVSAHTDSRGEESYNRALSERRANSVVNYLNDSGVERTRLRTQAHGESKPIATNNTPEGRRLNRRVELFLED